MEITNRAIQLLFVEMRGKIMADFVFMIVYRMKCLRRNRQ